MTAGCSQSKACENISLTFPTPRLPNLLDGTKHFQSKSTFSLGELHMLDCQQDPTLTELRRDIDLNSTRCPVCDDDIETEEHLFISCIVAKETWLKVFKWWNIQYIPSSNLHETINLSEWVNLPSHQLLHFDAVVQTSLWVLWKFQNDMTFSLKRPSKELIVNDIKLSSFSWITSRIRKVNLNWINWFNDPCNAILM